MHQTITCNPQLLLAYNLPLIDCVIKTSYHNLRFCYSKFIHSLLVYSLKKQNPMATGGRITGKYTEIKIRKNHTITNLRKIWL